MTKQNIIRFLSGLTFLIFFCPFFQMCSDKDMMVKREEVATEEISAAHIDEQNSAKQSEETIALTHEEKIKREEELKETRKKYTLNGYELAFLQFGNINELTFDDIVDSGFIFLSFYTFIVVSMLLIFISAIQKKSKTVIRLSVVNLLLGTISIIIFVSDPLFKELSQIKFGYYLFIINTLALIIFSKKSKTAIAT